MATATVQELAQMAASCRAQSGWLTRAVDTCTLVVAEAAIREPNRPLMVQLDRCLAEVRDQEKKCAQICEDIRDGQEQNAANDANIKASLNRDSNRAMQLALFALEHPLFSRRLDFFRFKQCRGQSMSNIMPELQRFGDQSNLGGLNSGT
jgi:hypothetical protein